MSDSDVVVSSSAGGVATITINRPDRRNALNSAVVEGLSEALSAAEAGDDVAAVVLTGAGDGAFCAGGDLGGTSSDNPIDRHHERAAIGNLFRSMRTSLLPIVARVNGHALAGGFGLMLACDLVVAADDVELGTPEVDLGLWPFMISALIHRDVPRKLALELMLTGRRMTASEAYARGLINRVTARADLDNAVGEMTAALVGKSSAVVALGKRSFYRSEDLDFDAALDYLAGMLTLCLQSEDAAEGISAFFQKRAPNWKGR